MSIPIFFICRTLTQGHLFQFHEFLLNKTFGIKPFSLFLGYNHSFIFSYKHLQGQNYLLVVKSYAFHIFFRGYNIHCYCTIFYLRTEYVGFPMKIKPVSFICPLSSPCMKSQSGDGVFESRLPGRNCVLQGCHPNSGEAVIQKSPRFCPASRG